MIVHKSETRGLATHGWLTSYHTFSFADYHNPERMNFGTLRVLNDDLISPNSGFGTHPHRDMEIISVPLSGTLEHKDSQGNHHFIKIGEIQTMSAGTGIYHSEYNASKSEEARFLQIWVLPKKRGIVPSYGQKSFNYKMNDKTLLVSPDGRGGSIKINQDAFFSYLKLDASLSFNYQKYLKENLIYLFIIHGQIVLHNETFDTRDGIGLSNDFTLISKSSCEILIMEIPQIN